jgi:hypothetical protein
MENGLNFEKPLRLQGRARAGWNGAGMFAYSSCITISCYYRRCKRILGRRKLCTLSRILGSKTAQEDVATWAPSGSDSLAEDWSILD